MIEKIEKLLLIRSGERANMLYFLSFFLLVSAGMAIGRSTADALFLKRLGIEYLPLMYMAQSLLLAAVSLVYVAFADRIPAEKFFRVLFAALFVLVLASWFVMSATDSTLVYPFYYLVYEVASELLLVHAALYMNQNMNTLQAKRLMPLLYAGAQVGSITGGLLLVAAAPVFGTRNLLLLWCALLVTGFVLLRVRHLRHGTSTHFRAPKKSRNLLTDCVEQVSQGMKFTSSSSLLRAASFALFFMVIAFYILCYSVNRIYTQTFDSEESLTRFFGLLTAVTGAMALFMQVFITNRAIRRFGIRSLNLLFPWTTFASLAALTVSFAFPVALLGSFNKDALMPAFRNPVRSLFFNVLPGYMQGRARAISVAVVLPLALMVCGVILILMQRLENPGYFLVPGMLAAGLYLFFSRRMNQAYVSTLLATLKERLFLPDKHMYADLQGAGANTLAEIMRGINHPDSEVALAFAKVLAASYPERAVNIILQRTRDTENAETDRFLKLLAGLDITRQADDLRRLAAAGDAHLQTTVMGLLLESGDTQILTAASALLDSRNPRLQSGAIHASLQQGATGDTRAQALAAWRALLAGSHNARLAALENIPNLAQLSGTERETLVPACLDACASLLADPGESTRVRALQGLHRWQGASTSEIETAVIQALTSDNPELRAAAAGCLHLVSREQRDKLLLQAIGDGHIRVRTAGIDTLRADAANYEELALEWISASHGSLRAQQTLLVSLLDAGLGATIFEDIVRSKSEAALQLQEAAGILGRETNEATASARALLEYTLKEQRDQTIELALQALEPLYDTDTIGIIRAGFISGDMRYVASACEVLGSLDNQDMIASLGDALQRSVGGDAGQDDRYFKSIDDVLTWCAQHNNHWLRLCGQQALAATGTGAAHG
ncbi:MAG: hypothetical protein WBO06_10520 [Gammaproteobacteria bacterium]